MGWTKLRGLDLLYFICQSWVLKYADEAVLNKYIPKNRTNCLTKKKVRKSTRHMSLIEYQLGNPELSQTFKGVH